jgi:hypothetical protein
MNKVLDPLKNIFARLRRQPEAPSDTAPKGRLDRFTLVSWGITWFIVICALGFALWKTQTAGAANIPLPTAAPDASLPTVNLPAAAGQSANQEP